MQDVCEEGARNSSWHQSSAAFVSERHHCRHLDPGLDFNFCEDWRMALPELWIEVLKRSDLEPIGPRSPSASLVRGMTPQP
jgi:hypothetical protein